MHNDDIRDEPIDAAGAPPRAWTMASIAILAMVIVVAGGLMIYQYSGSRDATNQAAQTGFAPIVDQVRPVPSTAGQGGYAR